MCLNALINDNTKKYGEYGKVTYSKSVSICFFTFTILFKCLTWHFDIVFAQQVLKNVYCKEYVPLPFSSSRLSPPLLIFWNHLHTVHSFVTLRFSEFGRSLRDIAPKFEFVHYKKAKITFWYFHIWELLYFKNTIIKNYYRAYINNYIHLKL